MNDSYKTSIILEIVILVAWLIIGIGVLITGTTTRITYGCILLMYIIKHITLICIIGKSND